MIQYELVLSFQPTDQIKYEAFIMILPSYDSVWQSVYPTASIYKIMA